MECARFHRAPWGLLPVTSLVHARRLVLFALELLSGSPVHGGWVCVWGVVTERCKSPDLVDPASIASLVM